MTSSRTRLLRASTMIVSAVAFCCVVNAGCDTGETNTNPRPICAPDAGPGCVGPTGGGSNSGSGSSNGGGGDGGSSATNDVTGKVGVLNDVAFSQISSYIGAATISTVSSTGAALNTPYGDMTTSFTLLDVMKGPTWFLVQDETLGATGIFSTFSVVNVPTNSPVTLPVVDRNVIASIAALLPAPVVIDGSRGVVVLKVVKNGQPLAGVSLTNALPGATLAYDTGIGLYSNQVLQTGPAGVILALNVDGPGNEQLMDLTLTDVMKQSYFVQIKVQAGAATFAGFEL